ncbi:hypothetical protein CYMTET_54499 [Cymbomonas tetramitiformis]|uniref:5'-deoxynucleotidase n=1 Tax=Cymbomonas tetramitiformis TaxID=36881 RepID=A0AAE0BET9_9CHLO|nr:hypothetical protein CYMTET_54499 [Cymbomonas tetramitiformis]
MSEQDVSSAIDLFSLVEKLKTSPRAGWLRFQIDHPESIADHMYRMSIMAMVAGRENGYDQSKCIKLAIAHDIAEAIVGDITPHDNVSKEEKHRLELAAINKICDSLGAQAAGKELKALWEEYESGETEEAKLLKDLDKVEMILQAHEYEQAQSVGLSEFFDSVKDKFKTPIGKAYAAEVVRRRVKAQGSVQES